MIASLVDGDYRRACMHYGRIKKLGVAKLLIILL